MESIRYTLRAPEPHTHYVEVEAAFAVAGTPSIELMMAVWTPGSYLVRDYAGKVEAIRASSGSGGDLEVRKVRKNRWRVDSAGADVVLLRYRVYCREMTVRSNWVEESFGFFNGAPTFITAVDLETDRPAECEHAVHVDLPSAWPRIECALPLRGDAYIARSFDELVDSPIVAGALGVDSFEAGGADHRMVHLGDWAWFDRPKAAADVHVLVEAQQRFWGAVPYGSYLFLNALTEARGGLEHNRSMLIMASRWATRTRKTYVQWLKLVSHEFFHVWNVKRLRPAALGPFDYERENHSRSLWVAEGITSYYEAVLLRRAGLVSDEEFLEALSEDIKAVQTTPGRLVDPVSEASFDAWIKLYKKDENSSNSTISYYAKGAVIAFLLDAEIRRRSPGRSLDDVMRTAWARFSGKRGFEEDEFRSLVSEVADDDLGGWLEGALDTTDELDYQAALDHLGLRFQGPESGDPPAGWIGAELENRNGQTAVTAVKRDTPAHDAGVQPGDELIAIDGIRVTLDGLEKRLQHYQPGDGAELTVARRERLTQLPITLGTPPEATWKLEADPEATAEAAESRRVWFEGE